MSASVGAYVAQVDRVLAAGQDLFVASTGPAGGLGGSGPSVPAAPADSGTSVGVADASAGYRRSWRGVTGLDWQTSDTADQGASEAQRGRSGAAGVRASARSQAAAIASAAGSPAGLRRLVSSMDAQLAAMQRQIDTTRAQNRLLGLRLRQLAAGYRGVSAGAPMSGVPVLRSARGVSELGGLGAMPAPGGLGPVSSGSQLAVPSTPGAVVVNSVHGPLPAGKASEKGLQKYTILVNRAVSAAFPQIQEIGGWRPDSLHWHPDGLALDVMIPGWNTPGGRALGDRIVSWLMANKSTLGVEHAIWRQAIYYDGNNGNPMEDRGSPTQNHMNHVHVATKGAAIHAGVRFTSCE